ncbi:stage II sporulation protein M [Pseudoxanthomonas winnipegensis]|uniref:stage II sporulation protein M n=1 Tax=Pseudoxanthomonas winnipegensis TaxID=2480810 RepID=UPI0030F4A21F
MRQEQFVARHQREWQELEDWLRTRADARRAQDTRNTGTLGDEAMPQRYRRIAQQLSLARRRGYSAQVTGRLQTLMEQGHQVLYRTPPLRWRTALEFLMAGFPRLVRSQARCMWVALALFGVPLVGMTVLLQFRPELIHALMDPRMVAAMERMYDPSSPRIGRDSGSDWMMFGVYIRNNIGIGLQTFASGLVVGVGSLVVLVSNGLTIGALFGHLTRIGSGGPLWSFVCGHGAFELTALVIAGGAGLQLGLSWLAPGRRTRGQALVQAGAIGARLCLGVAFMLLVAAFIEAFWSSVASIPHPVKYAVAAVLWTGVIVWLWRGGRGGAERDRDAR